MNTVIGWVLKWTGLGKVNEMLTGYRAQILAFALALSLTAAVLTKLPDLSLSGLVALVKEPEFKEMLAAWAAFFALLKGKRIEAKLDAQAAVAVAQKPAA